MKKREIMSEMSLVLVTMIWGCGFIATEYVIKANWSTSLIMATRFIIAAVAMGIALNKKILELTKYEILHGSIAGILLFLGFFTQTLGQAQTTVSHSAFITATYVVMVPFISWAVNRNRPDIRTVLLTLMALVGAGVLSYTNGKYSPEAGDLLILSSAFFFAAQITYAEKATKGSDPARVNFVQIMSAAVSAFVVFLFQGNSIKGADISQGLMPILYLGILSTCLCYFLQTTAQKHVTASKVGVILSLEGLFGGLFSVLLGLEPLTINLLAGGALIIGAGIFMNIDIKALIKRNEDGQATKLGTENIQE